MIPSHLGSSPVLLTRLYGIYLNILTNIDCEYEYLNKYRIRFNFSHDYLSLYPMNDTPGHCVIKNILSNLKKNRSVEHVLLKHKNSCQKRELDKNQFKTIISDFSSSKLEFAVSVLPTLVYHNFHDILNHTRWRENITICIEIRLGIFLFNELL